MQCDEYLFREGRVILLWNASHVPPLWQTPIQPLGPTLMIPYVEPTTNMGLHVCLKYQGKNMSHFSPFSESLLQAVSFTVGS